MHRSEPNDATQTVFGEGMKKSRVLFVGKQPGDKEDRAGKPFVGPAGRELDRALDEVGIDRGEVYASFRITRERGRPLDSDLAELVLATAHPSSILRQRTDEDRHEERRLFTEDLRVVAEAL